ncbi:uncharacterized protein LOC115962006 [Quercus lobata]|uniref:uncharacterized protein LOC115962006 n=1 Tax=Quercus lobata TaxID=97700 RepID=UPI001244FA64|nr:uncharacterized protein LOC115962006 [Quercus lobata]
MGIEFPKVRVNSLINAQTRNWDVDLLQALFKPEEVQLIRGISLGDVSARDKMIWPHTQSGTYTEEICDHCKSHSEDIVHALWLCPCLNEVWEADTGWSFRNTVRWDDFQKLILHVEEVGLDLDLFAMIIWLLWHRRNQIKVGNSATSLGQIVACARQQLQDYNLVQPMKPATESANLHTAVTWSPPRAPFLKINYNGAVFQDSNSAGLGAVILDSVGGVLASLAENIPLPQTVADMEAAAVRRAIMLATDLNLSSIVLKGDSEIITRAIQAEEQSLASYGNLIEEIRLHVDSFLNFRITHVKRKRNSVTHRLARHVSDLVVWMEEVPSHILPVLLTEAG